ncbi:hypothetical protein, partial [Klebsiella pneumoniae]|uniref:hypothetical protein n=1 Tax=Klebsiella pneumoniae TaxID=573 RepID=UPI003013B0C5
GGDCHADRCQRQSRAKDNSPHEASAASFLGRRRKLQAKQMPLVLAAQPVRTKNLSGQPS